MGAASYSSDKLIAHVNAGSPIQTYVAVKKLEFENYCFEITQVVCAGGRETILQQKRTTHYHKAIGIAVCINS